MSEASRKNIDIEKILQKALWEPLVYEEINHLSFSTRCFLIKNILAAYKENRKKDFIGMANISLLRLSKSFEMSEAFQTWQEAGFKKLKQKFKFKNASPLLIAFRNWHRISSKTKQYALRQSANLHAKTYIEGFSEKLPYQYEFLENGTRKTRNTLTYLFGTFNGDLKTGTGKIIHYTNEETFEKSRLEAFDTAHHECTHLIQHHLAVAFRKKSISHSHPLYKDAEYFYEIALKNAIMPPYLIDAYQAQPSEVFARWEGCKISSAIEELAL